MTHTIRLASTSSPRWQFFTAELVYSCPYLWPVAIEYVQPIPADILELTRNAGRGAFVRADPTLARAAMTSLGIRDDTDFYAFASCYRLGNLFPERHADRMVDVCDPTQQVAQGTAFARSVWELPDQYVCFTTCQGEGGYLYSTTTGEVFDFDLASRDEFLRKPVARWKSFFDFLRWYMAPRSSVPRGRED